MMRNATTYTCPEQIERSIPLILEVKYVELPKYTCLSVLKNVSNLFP